MPPADATDPVGRAARLPGPRTAGPTDLAGVGDDAAPRRPRTTRTGADTRTGRATGPDTRTDRSTRTGVDTGAGRYPRTGGTSRAGLDTGAGRYPRTGGTSRVGLDTGDTLARDASSTGRHRTAGHRSDRGRHGAGGPPSRRTKGANGKRRGSFVREIPILIAISLALTIVIQLFIGRLYEIPSGSMETTLHGCTGCTDDRVAVDKMVYHFSDPEPGDVVVFKGTPDWPDTGDTAAGQRSGNPIVRTVQGATSLVGLTAPDESDFVKRVIAVGGQTVACCDAQNRVMVDGRPLNEPYLYWEPDRGPPRQEPFDPFVVPQGQFWAMGDNRNNSGDSRFNGPVPTANIIGKARAVVLPVNRWRTVPNVDPQTSPADGP